MFVALVTNIRYGINQFRPMLTQCHHKSTSTAFYRPSTTKYQPKPAYTVDWGLQTPAQFTPGLVPLGVRWLDAPITIFSRQRTNPPEIFSCSICQYFARLTSKTNSVWMALTNILRNLLFRFLLRPLSWKSMYLPPLHPPTVQLTDKMAKGHWSSFFADSLQTEYCSTFLLSVCPSVWHRRDILHFSHI